MSSQNSEPRDTADVQPSLELNKETLQDLDVEPADANEVKGGGSLVAVPSLGAAHSVTASGSQPQFSQMQSLSSAIALSRER